MLVSIARHRRPEAVGAHNRLPIKRKVDTCWLPGRQVSDRSRRSRTHSQRTSAHRYSQRMSPSRQNKRTHAYEVHCHWAGSTGLGYEHYDRTLLASAPPASPSLTLSTDRAFRGDPNLLNPEQLLVLAAMSCQLLSFLAVAARARIDVLEYDDVGEGVMPDDDLPRPSRSNHCHQSSTHDPGRHRSNRRERAAPCRGRPPRVLHRELASHDHFD
jgi:organic hydroperoxide reductase OsmC/OhrA